MKNFKNISKDATATNAQLSDKKGSISEMNQVLNINNNFFNINSYTGFKSGWKADLEADFNFDDANKANLVSEVLVIEVDKSRISKSKKRKSNKSDIAKRANLPDKMFKYIYVA